jgi:hypothetical protein
LCEGCGDKKLELNIEGKTEMDLMRDVLREKKQRLEAAELRAGILEGYQDAITDRTTKFSGNLKDDMAKFKKGDKKPGGLNNIAQF